MFTCAREHHEPPSRSPCRFFKRPSSVPELPRTPLRDPLSPLPTPDCAGGTAETAPERTPLPGNGVAPWSAEEAAGVAVDGADGVLAADATAAPAAAVAVAAVPPLLANSWNNEDPALLSKPGVRQLGASQYDGIVGGFGDRTSREKKSIHTSGRQIDHLQIQ